MATSPLFGWEEPDDTDLVKDGAAAIRTLGNAIDTSMGDLLGGTTGQVLSKASNTNMDFTWVTSDDANAIQNTIVDAKGDLIAASASDTPARLAVGADYGFLQALASESTGLTWNSGAWTTYTPTVTASSGSFTTVSGQGKYLRVGKMCVLQFAVNTTTNGTAAQSVRVTLPFAAQNTGPALYSQGVVRDYFVTGIGGFAFLDPSNNYVSYAKYDGTYLGGSGYFVGGSIVYEVA